MSSEGMEFDPAGTPRGKLPPWEVAKAIAFQEVISKMEEHLGKTCKQLTGLGKADFTAEHLTVVGGWEPTGRAVQLTWTKVKEDEDWFPGKKTDQRSGRPPSISEAQSQAIADKAMELKKDLVAPTPEKIRVLLPRKTINKKTGAPISDEKIRTIFKTLCYDEDEDDPWHYLPSPQQDCLTDEMKPARVRTAKHLLQHVTKGAAWNFVAIDPCFSLLARKQEKSDLLKIAAMGNKKWMSKKSKRKGANLRAPKTAKTQKSSCTVVPWTPVFTRGRVKLVVLTEPGAKLNSSVTAGDFVRNSLPAVLQSMKKEWKWSTIPRVVLHDKASYFVNSKTNRLNPTFCEGLQGGQFSSWVDDGAQWLAPHLGDLYLHETVISHVRRLLYTKFARKALYETPLQFAARMSKIEHHLNHEMGDGESLLNLGKDLHQRCEDLKKLHGERLPK
jgi:hypothetical protein